MAGINKVILIGHLGRDPEVMTFEKGSKKASFSLATTESYRDKEGNWQEQTEWHNIVVWGYLAEKSIIKGDQVYVEGRLRSRSYEDSNGVKKYVTEVQGDRILKLSSPNQSNTGTPTSTETDKPQFNTTVENEADDLPF